MGSIITSKELVSVLFGAEEFDFCSAPKVLFLIKRASTVQWDYMFDLSNLHRNPYNKTN
jgi:hypothetical protein